MEFFDSTKKPIDLEKQGYSVDVLIDVDGNRKNFEIGWWDYDDQLWRFHNVDANELHDIVDKKLLWAYLPLAELDGIDLKTL